MIAKLLTNQETIKGLIKGHIEPSEIHLYSNANPTPEFSDLPSELRTLEV